MIKFDLLFGFAILGLTIFSIIDCARTPQDSVRNLPKWAWLSIIIFTYIIVGVGSVAWLIAGRPKGDRPHRNPRRGRNLPPDDNPDFLRNL